MRVWMKQQVRKWDAWNESQMHGMPQTDACDDGMSHGRMGCLKSPKRLGSSLVAGAQPSAWYSQSKLFAFGFYPQGAGYLVAIWLTLKDKENANKVVWTLGRDNPPVSPNTTLNLTHKGELVLISEKGDIRKPVTTEASISFAVLENNGNFMLYNNHMEVLWQSFDNPPDTILQGQSLRGGIELVSSTSKTNYSSGRFHIKMQTDGNLVMYPTNTTDEPLYAYWATETYVGPLTKSESYLHLNDTGLQLLDNRTSTAIQFLYTELSYPVMYRATLGYDGIFRLYAYRHTNSSPSLVWSKPDDPCDVKNYCGFNSYCTRNGTEQHYCVCLPGSDFIDLDQKSSGCQKNFTDKRCGSRNENVTYYNLATEEQLLWEEDGFYYRAIADNKQDCSKSCLEDCDCDAATFLNGYCSKYKYPLRYVHVADVNAWLSFFKTTNNASLYVQPNEFFNSSSVRRVPQAGDKVVVTTTTSKKTWILILVITIGFSIYSCISLSLSGYFVFKFRLLKYKRLLESKTLGLAEDLILRSYSYSELKKATNGFKQELGRGSFGTVYKGSLYKGKKPIAVKRLEKVVDEGEREFRAEMQVIGKTHHKNLVRLLGYCAEGKTQRLLVYEYMSNGTLADCLFKSERLPYWSERVRIALDVARGILYLHEECETPIIHCDIKPQNILMDDFWTAKISDFGLAKLLMPDQTKTFTIVRGTRGYLAPEWQKNSPISLKVDIFSYGIVLLETICCRRNLDVHVSNPDEIVLSSWVYKCFERGQLDLLVNLEEVEKEALERLVKVGLWCIQDEPAHRPSMKCVLLMLEGITDIATPPCPTSTW
ncbi:G-type lectin S-receptor-like serine/threonine-protein kinase LECRK3 [Helianthus annuus]|nr:G-type lectin S-receptor-like serine/threonine-protein kinase LECRK3 [Helianthus annuus]